MTPNKDTQLNGTLMIQFTEDLPMDLVDKIHIGINNRKLICNIVMKDEVELKDRRKYYDMFMEWMGKQKKNKLFLSENSFYEMEFPGNKLSNESLSKESKKVEE